MIIGRVPENLAPILKRYGHSGNTCGLQKPGFACPQHQNHGITNSSDGVGTPQMLGAPDMDTMTSTARVVNEVSTSSSRDAVKAEIELIADATRTACLATRVRQLSRIITRVYDDAMRPLGITASQFTLLTQLANQDSITAVEIGFTLDIEKSTLSRNLKRLLALGLLVMDPPAGRRGRGLHLTAKGQEVIKLAFPVWQDAQRKASAVMGSDSRATLDTLLNQAEKLAVV
jgi:DNA-binding MarR family transcriptional regulator